MPTTSGRSRGRQGVRPGGQGPAREHWPQVLAGVVTASVGVGFTLVMTKPGRDIAASTQHFMLYYAGVFALILLTASVGAGLLATDRIFMTPGHRVMAQAVHRAVSFGALAFLVIHIVTEILAQRVHAIDSLIPFLSPYRTFYIGLGTIASDLVLLLVVTSIFRKRFTAHGKAWRWRAIHYASYAAFALGVFHGLLSGRTAQPYVDWSYGFAIGVTVLALVVRLLVISLRPKWSLSAAAGADLGPGGPATSPLRAAALSVTQAQLGGTIHVLPGAQGTVAWALAPAARDGFAISGPFPALEGPPPFAEESVYAAYQDPAFMPLGAPAYVDGAQGRPGAYPGAYPYGAADAPARQPRYEPGYDGPPRFEGAPRRHVPQDDASSYPYGPQPRQARNTGPMPRVDTGPLPRAGTGRMPRADTGPIPRPASGPLPYPAGQAGTGPLPRADTGPLPRAGTGPMPRADTGPLPRAGTGPMPRADTGPMRRASGPAPYSEAGPLPRAGTGPMPRADAEPRPRTGPALRPDSPPGPHPRPAPGTRRRARWADSADPTSRGVPRATGGNEWR